MNDKILKLVTSDILEDVLLGLYLIKDLSEFEMWLQDPPVLKLDLAPHLTVKLVSGILKNDFGLYTHRNSPYILGINKLRNDGRLHVYYEDLKSMSTNNNTYEAYKDFRK